MQQAENESAEVVLRRLDEQHQKYKFMEQNLNLKKKRCVSEAFLKLTSTISLQKKTEIWFN